MNIGGTMDDPIRHALSTFSDDEHRRRNLKKALDSLPHREGRTLALLFGFSGSPLTYDEAATELDVCVDCVKRFEGQGLSKLAALKELAELAK